MIDSQGRVLTSRADSILVDQLCHEPVERGQIITGVLVEPGGADGRHPPADVVLMHLGYPMVAPTVRVSEQSAPCVHHQPFVHRNVSRQSSGHQDDQRSGEIRRWYALFGSRPVYQHRIAGGHHHVVKVNVSVTKEISIWQRIEHCVGLGLPFVGRDCGFGDADPQTLSPGREVIDAGRNDLSMKTGIRLPLEPETKM